MPDTTTDSGAADVEEEEEEYDESSSGSSNLGPLEGFEVLRVRGRSLDAIKTDVPDSVTSFDQATLAALGAQDVSDLARVTPNVEIVSGTATQASFFIRGIGLSDFGSNAAGAVAVFRDDIALNTPPLQTGKLFDVEDVQILRGPQAFGADRNASGGSIRTVSRRPTGIFSADLKATLGTWDPTTPDAHDGLLQDYEGAIEVPLVEGTLSTRMAFRFVAAEPYKTNGCGSAPPLASRIERGTNVGAVAPAPGASLCGEQAPWMFDQSAGGTNGAGISLVPAGLPEKVGDQNNWAARGMIRLQPENSDMDWLVTVHGSRLSQQSTLGQAIGTGRVQGGQLNFSGTTFGVPIGLGSSSSVTELYWEPDQQREWLKRCPAQSNCNDELRALAKALASGRPLDTRPYRGDYDRVGLTQLDTWGASLRGDFAVGDIDVTMLTAYDTYERKINQDADFTPHRLFELDNEDRAWQIWQQLSAKGELDVLPLRWDTGVYYFMENLDFRGLTFGPYNQAPNLRFLRNDLRDYTQDIYSFGVWGSLKWDILDDFTLEAGFRYNWERKVFDFRTGKPECIPPIMPGGTPSCFPFGEAQQDEVFKEPTGSVRLTYRFSDEISAYWKYSHGFKAGHFNAQADVNKVEQPPASPETLDAFEAGLQGSFFDDRISVSGAIFYYLYEDYQLFLFTDLPNASPVLEVVNANDAQLYGAEAELRFEPLSGLVYDSWDDLVAIARFGWLEGEFIDFQNERTGQLQTGATFSRTIDYTGNRLPNTPRFKVSGDVYWTFDFGRWGSIVPRYNFSWSDDTVFDATNGQGTPTAQGTSRLPEGTIGQSAYWIHNVRFTYRAPTGNMEISAWVRNIEDQVFKTFAFDVSEFQRLTVNFVGEPRTIGVDLQFTF